MANALLVGNGVNQLGGGQAAWFKVLSNLAESIQHPELMENAKHKPFTLIYEEIALLSGVRAADEESNISKKPKELLLKKKVATKISQIQHNDYHERLVKSVPKHIITTNYDYNLEKASGFPAESANTHSESKYNAFRRQKVGEKFIWHVHGEADVPVSITLGHEQYAGQLQKLRSYVTGDGQSTNKPESPFKLRILDFDDGRSDPYSWVDVFFRDDTHIVGLALDYTEIDLWWLIAYKARMRQMSGYDVGKTFYYSPKPEGADDAEIAKLSILRSLGVIPVEVEIRGSYAKLYDVLLGTLGYKG